MSPATAAPPAAALAERASPKDLAFCAELAFHGGVATSERGFEAEAELVRMRQAGLLDLERHLARPFMVTRVALSDSARDLLCGRGRIQPSVDGNQARHEEMNVASLTEFKQERALRCRGFEVARGMIHAAVKSEIAKWKAQGAHRATVELETCIMQRISNIEAPFSG